MKQKYEDSLYHRRASSDNAHARNNSQKQDESCWGNEMGKLNKEQEELLQALAEAAKAEGKLTKLEKIRIMQWNEKLSSKPNNPVWRKNIIFHLKVLMEMVHQEVISLPFSAVPVEGPLPNLKLLDLPFPIREKIAQKDKSVFNSSNKAKSRQGSVEKQNYNKAKSINFNEDMKIDMSSVEEVKINLYPKARKPSMKSCQVSGKREQSKIDVNTIKLKLTADHNKQNSSNSLNSASVTRRLFQNQSSQNILLTYKNEKAQPPQNTTISSFEGLDHHNKVTRTRGISLLLKVFNLIEKNADLDDDTEAKAICSSISRIAQQMGISLTNESLNQSNISSSSTQFRQASENIRLKFMETNEETLQFMSFLHRFRLKNQ